MSGKEKVEAVLVNGQELPADGLFILRNSIAPAALVEGLVLEEGYIKVNHKWKPMFQDYTPREIVPESRCRYPKR